MMWLEVKLNLDLRVIVQCEVTYRVSASNGRTTWTELVGCPEMIAVPVRFYEMWRDDVVESHFFCGRH